MVDCTLLILSTFNFWNNYVLIFVNFLYILLHLLQGIFPPEFVNRFVIFPYHKRFDILVELVIHQPTILGLHMFCAPLARYRTLVKYCIPVTWLHYCNNLFKTNNTKSDVVFFFISQIFFYGYPYRPKIISWTKALDHYKPIILKTILDIT